MMCKQLKIIIFLSIFLIPGCYDKPYAVNTKLSVSGNTGAVIVYVADHGWHTGFIVPVDEINSDLPDLFNRFGKVKYYEFGWGDEGFYRAEEITVGLALKAVFWPTNTVLHVVAVNDDPHIFFSGSEIIKISVNKEAFDGLKQFIISSFAKDTRGRLHSLGPGIYGNSRFYGAQGKYFVANTCNKWTAKGLKSMGLDISPTFKLTADSIMGYLKKAGYPEISEDTYNQGNR